MGYKSQVERLRQYYNVGGSKVSRTFADEVKVILPCGYTQRFWDIAAMDTDLVQRTRLMKSQNIKSN